MLIFKEFKKDQLDGLAKLCFDLAKGAFLIAFFPTPQSMSNPFIALLNIFIGLLIGLAFTYCALLLLERKNTYEYS